MNVSQWALPAGLAVAGIGAVVTVGMLLGHRRRAGEQSATAEERAQLALQRRHAWQRRMAVIALAIGCLMMFVLAGIAAWLSFGAQREYAHAHNGGDWDAATGFALLLDAGALSLSLIRFFEALTLRSSAITRILLLAFVSASAAMNLLHAPGQGAGSAFLAVVPPLVYAILLEMLLFKIEQVIMGRQKRRKADQERGYSLLLWLPWPIGAPVKMWKAWRSELLATVDNVRVIGSQRPLPQAAEPAPAPPVTPAPARVTLERADPAQPPAGAPAPVGRAVGRSAANALLSVARPPVQVSGKTAVPEAPEAVSAPATPPSAPEPAAAGGPDEPAGKEDKREAPIPPATTAPKPQPEATADGSEEAPLDPEDTSDDGESGTAHRDEPEASADDESGSEKPDTQHDRSESGTGDDEARGEQRPVQIDLSTLPKDEGPRQRAERIYVAHQVAGLPLDKADLGKWAGYMNSRSGGNEYRRLEKEYGPILEREGAAEVDLDWFSLDQQADSGRASVAA
ncbi:DUF2637 domain-containing protein [Streptomyces sp. NBC_00829]|uniref:DUF2637 domain-containing protein n=1 Tax=Streptomyces sp. NBC_00829 TaxID=2903679 RepID=UPI002F9194DE|nr:DUF2637 domain-containing protein [Streptomyces sp. NBC_00829]